MCTPAEYAVLYPDCDINLADLNGDGLVNSGDLEGFTQWLFALQWISTPTSLGNRDPMRYDTAFNDNATLLRPRR